MQTKLPRTIGALHTTLPSRYSGDQVLHLTEVVEKSKMSNNSLLSVQSYTRVLALRYRVGYPPCSLSCLLYCSSAFYSNLHPDRTHCFFPNVPTFGIPVLTLSLHGPWPFATAGTARRSTSFRAAANFFKDPSLSGIRFPNRHRRSKTSRCSLYRSSNDTILSTFIFSYGVPAHLLRLPFAPG
jgi:hypothetical protein